jgi:hypothetical protein
MVCLHSTHLGLADHRTAYGGTPFSFYEQSLTIPPAQQVGFVSTKPFNLAEISFRVKSILRVRYLNDELERAVACIQELQKNRPKL